LQAGRAVHFATLSDLTSSGQVIAEVILEVMEIILGS
jgi:hypothetical protein